MNKLRFTTITALALCLTAGHVLAQQSTENNINYYIAHAPFKMPAIIEPRFNGKTFNIKAYGAVNNGQILNTTAFEKAITACNAAGGGTVLIPPGLWLTGPIELKSNVNLHAERGALITFTTDHTQYPIVNGKTQLPLSGNKLENVAITGEGIFDGGGDSWRPLKKIKAAPSLWSDLLKKGGVVSKDGSMYWPTKEAMDGEDYIKTVKNKSQVTPQDYLPARDFLRPTMVAIQNSNNVLIDGPTFKNSPQFALNPKNCTNMIIRNVTINNEYAAQNGDGIDISSSKNVIIYHCTVNAGDDGICMKSSGKGDALNNPALKNVIIADCIVYHAHGGFVIGSNTDGGMQNIYVTNCNYVNTDVGIRIKSSRGRGGPVHDIYIDNVYMHDILNESILFSTYYEDDVNTANANQKFEVNSQTPRFYDFHISNIYGSGAKSAISIVGLPEMPVSHIYLSDMVLSTDKGIDLAEASDIFIKNVKVLTPQKTLITANNAWNIDLNNMSFSDGTQTFIDVRGEKSKSINISLTNLKSVKAAVKTGTGVLASAVSVK